MVRSLRNLLLLTAAALTIPLAVIVINQTLQLAEFAARFHPTAGQVVFWFLIAVYLGCMLLPLALYYRLPRRLEPPATTDGPEYDRHLERLRRRLAANPRTAELPLNDRDAIERAIHVLDAEADQMMQRSASRVFVTTAVSQNGSLDALVVIAVHGKLVWDIARLYSQRPNPREIGALYANVFGTAFIAGRLEDADIAEQVQPVISTVIGSAAGAVPGLQAVSTVVLSSMITGSANAFLTLRVGMIAREYSRAMVRQERSLLRRSATSAAAAMLGSVVAGQATRVTRAIYKASTRSVGSVLSGVGNRFKDAGASLAAGLKRKRRDVGESDTNDG